MKRYVKSTEELLATITITMDIHTKLDKVAATDYIQHPKSISKKRRIPDSHLAMLNDIVASFDSNIRAVGFPIIDEHWPKKSYSYYIKFIPITESGEELLPVKLVFRVANHSNIPAEDSSDSDIVQIVSFTLEHEDKLRSWELIHRGAYILQELRKGNVNVLDEIRTNKIC